MRTPFSGDSPVAVAYQACARISRTPVTPDQPRHPARARSRRGQGTGRRTPLTATPAAEMRADLCRFHDGEQPLAAEVCSRRPIGQLADVGAAGRSRTVPVLDPRTTSRPPVAARRRLLVGSILLLASSSASSTVVVTSRSTTAAARRRCARSPTSRQDPADAITEIQTASLSSRSRPDGEARSLVPKGPVVAVDPTPGARSRWRGRRDGGHADVSAGRRHREIPDVVGTPSCDEAVRTLAAAPFQVHQVPAVRGVAVPRRSREGGPGSAQAAGAGRRRRDGSADHAHHLLGPPMDWPVPAVAGQERGDSAASTLGQAGFQTTTPIEASDSPRARPVICTDPAERHGGAEGLDRRGRYGRSARRRCPGAIGRQPDDGRRRWRHQQLRARAPGLDRGDATVVQMFRTAVNAPTPW